MFQQLGKMIHHSRKKRGWSRMHLAACAGVGKTVIFDIERGKATVKAATLLKVLTALEIKMLFRTPEADVCFK